MEEATWKEKRALECQVQELQKIASIEKRHHTYWHKVACVSMGLNAAILSFILAVAIWCIARR